MYNIPCNPLKMCKIVLTKYNTVIPDDVAEFLLSFLFPNQVCRLIPITYQPKKEEKRISTTSCGKQQSTVFIDSAKFVFKSCTVLEYLLSITKYICQRHLRLKLFMYPRWSSY